MRDYQTHASRFMFQGSSRMDQPEVNNQPRPRPVVLVILDGWGINPQREYNAVALAATPNMDHLWEQYPHTQLNASEHFVGLPEGQMGNSEVGHQNMGAGFVVYQELTRLDNAI